jgi:hypothetical protein
MDYTHKTIDQLIEFKDSQYHSFWSFFSKDSTANCNFDKLFQEIFNIKLKDNLILSYDGFEIIDECNEDEQSIFIQQLHSTVCIKINIFIKIIQNDEEGNQKVLFREKYLD